MDHQSKTIILHEKNSTMLNNIEYLDYRDTKNTHKISDQK